jgi:hypothetical protein
MNKLGAIFTFYMEKNGKISLFRTYDPVKDYELILPPGFKEEEEKQKMEERKKQQIGVVPREKLEYVEVK